MADLERDGLHVREGDADGAGDLGGGDGGVLHAVAGTDGERAGVRVRGGDADAFGGDAELVRDDAAGGLDDSGPTPTKSQMATTSFVAPSSRTRVRTLRLSWMPVEPPWRAP